MTKKQSLDIIRVLNIAKMCYEVNRAFSKGMGDESHKSWEGTPENIQASVIDGVEYHLKSNTSPEQSHQNWLRFKKKDGWVYGEVKDIVKKTHPLMVPFSELPLEDKLRDYLFKAIVESFPKN